MLVLTNEWTNAKNGHARRELELASDLLKSQGCRTSIASVDRAFGDLFLGNTQHLLHFLLPDRGPVFRWKKRKNLRKFGKSLSRAVHEDMSVKRIIFTSQHANTSELILPKIKNIKMSLRFISIPSRRSDLLPLQRLLERRKSNLINLAVETNSQKELLFNKIDCDIAVIPPISTLEKLKKSKSQERRVGLLWPTAHPESPELVQKYINCLQKFNLYVRVPRRIRNVQLQGLQFNPVEQDLSTEDFLIFCQNLDAVVLPHRRYEMRGSSLASMFIGQGIPIIARSENAFFKDLVPLGLVIPFQEDSLAQAVDIALNIDEGLRIRTSEEYRSTARKAWLKFLLGEHEE